MGPVDAPRPLKAQLITYALVVVAYLPWLPSYLLQQKHSANEARRIASLVSPSLGVLWRLCEQAIFGAPFLPLHVLPGTIPLIAAFAAIAVAAILVSRRVLVSSSWRPQLASPLTLISCWRSPRRWGSCSPASDRI